MRSPAWAASGWLVVTMACGAMTSARLCPRQPSARSPGTATQAATSTSPAQMDSGGVACARAKQGTSAATMIAAPPRVFKGLVMDCSRIVGGSLHTYLAEGQTRGAKINIQSSLRVVASFGRYSGSLGALGMASKTEFTHLASCF
jgi:hypothetical protein